MNIVNKEKRKKVERGYRDGKGEEGKVRRTIINGLDGREKSYRRGEWAWGEKRKESKAGE